MLRGTIMYAKETKNEAYILTENEQQDLLKIMGSEDCPPPCPKPSE